ncbi:glutamine synthetase beta-grasp domain-containing protein [Flavilitoribacter nigricans]|uniref:Glutamine synthetase n=1 Tax=Flavilitoribacter nigricans (strain ATCC 23147 / DSM 23189 / NBRC 102662 / NCIMB 1420 / SS-2) TaxID=1122177 RepID=A0A2D0N1L3_FLAN2|nr:glutamine synthetase beta-grasp domain-containing protein [Flavilitoribacter nigricans]PHN01603.1 glutamine synthetase [Flavilitoribacter nigricans DSM 23189 = NBRC 102662]
MEIFKCEYIWLDGYRPEANLRGKTKVLALHETPNLNNLPMWSFDGSSTRQAEGNASDCLLKPVKVWRDAGRNNGYLVLCEVLNADGTPHVSNYRATYPDNDDFWFGFEQEYVITRNSRPLGFPEEGYPAPQGEYYCGVGNERVVARDFVEEHLELCLACGLQITGINAEVMIGQWEFQLLGKGAKGAADDLWLARYLLLRLAEKAGVEIELHPKPVKGDWNGSGMHTNFSNEQMRTVGGEPYFQLILDKLKENHREHIAEYGSMNHERLTGLHETQAIDQFSYGVSDRGASIRIPLTTIENDWKGYLEDRRPASNACPYRVTAKILNTVPLETMAY